MELAARRRTSDNLAYLGLLALGALDALDAAGYSIIAPVLPAILSRSRP